MLPNPPREGAVAVALLPLDPRGRQDDALREASRRASTVTVSSVTFSTWIFTSSVGPQ